MLTLWLTTPKTTRTAPVSYPTTPAAPLTMEMWQAATRVGFVTRIIRKLTGK